MTALDALAPMHAMFHAAATAAALPSAPSAPSDRSDPMLLKYITVEIPGGQIVPLVFPSSLQHRDAVPEALRPVSAGFVMLFDGELYLSDIGSDTLRLNPRPEDRALLSALFRNPQSAIRNPKLI